MNDFQKYLDDNLKNINLNNDTDIQETTKEYDAYEEIRNSIIALRKSNNMTQKELAEKAGLTQANICNLEKGVTKPTLDSLRKIADATKTRLVVRFDEQEVL